MPDRGRRHATRTLHGDVLHAQANPRHQTSLALGEVEEDGGASVARLDKAISPAQAMNESPPFTAVGSRLRHGGAQWPSSNRTRAGRFRRERPCQQELTDAQGASTVQQSVVNADPHGRHAGVVCNSRQPKMGADLHDLDTI